jgi:hypothetical protein
MQQQVMKRKGTSFKGVYLIPYRPNAPYWKYTYDFQILKIYTTRDIILEAPSHRGKTAKGMNNIPTPIPMCVLYDPGYTQPDTLMSFMNAMEACAIAYDNLSLTQIPAFESFSDINDGRAGQEFDTPIKPHNPTAQDTPSTHSNSNPIDPTFCPSTLNPKPPDIPDPGQAPLTSLFGQELKPLGYTT